MTAPVLLVHDDIATIASVRRLLARDGFEVILATSAADAVIAFGHYLPSLVILAPGVEGGRGQIVLEELAQHPDRTFARVLLLGESVPGFGAPVVPLPLDGRSFLELVHQVMRDPSDGASWRVIEGHRRKTTEIPALVPRAPEEWRATGPREAERDLEEELLGAASQLDEADWELAAMTSDERLAYRREQLRARQAEAAAQAAFEETHREVEAEAIATLENTLPDLQEPSPPPPASRPDLDAELEDFEREVLEAVHERRRQREARKAAQAREALERARSDAGPGADASSPPGPVTEQTDWLGDEDGAARAERARREAEEAAAEEARLAAEIEARARRAAIAEDWLREDPEMGASLNWNDALTTPAAGEESGVPAEGGGAEFEREPTWSAGEGTAAQVEESLSVGAEEVAQAGVAGAEAELAQSAGGPFAAEEAAAGVDTEASWFSTREEAERAAEAEIAASAEGGDAEAQRAAAPEWAVEEPRPSADEPAEELWFATRGEENRAAEATEFAASAEAEGSEAERVAEELHAGEAASAAEEARRAAREEAERAAEAEIAAGAAPFAAPAEVERTQAELEAVPELTVEGSRISASELAEESWFATRQDAERSAEAEIAAGAEQIAAPAEAEGIEAERAAEDLDEAEAASAAEEVRRAALHEAEGATEADAAGAESFAAPPEAEGAEADRVVAADLTAEESRLPASELAEESWFTAREEAERAASAERFASPDGAEGTEAERAAEELQTAEAMSAAEGTTREAWEEAEQAAGARRIAPRAGSAHPEAERAAEAEIVPVAARFASASAADGSAPGLTAEDPRRAVEAEIAEEKGADAGFAADAEVFSARADIETSEPGLAADAGFASEAIPEGRFTAPAEAVGPPAELTAGAGRLWTREEAERAAAAEIEAARSSALDEAEGAEADLVADEAPPSAREEAEQTAEAEIDAQGAEAGLGAAEEADDGGAADFGADAALDEIEPAAETDFAPEREARLAARAARFAAAERSSFDTSSVADLSRQAELEARLKEAEQRRIEAEARARAAAEARAQLEAELAAAASERERLAAEARTRAAREAELLALLTEKEEALAAATARVEALIAREREASNAAQAAREDAARVKRDTERRADELRAETEATIAALRQKAERSAEVARREREEREALAARLALLQRESDEAQARADAAQRLAEAERAQLEAEQEARGQALREAARARDEAETAARVVHMPFDSPALRALDVPPAGTVQTEELARLILRLSTSRAELRLDLRVDDALRTLWFQRGLLVGAASSLAHESVLARARRDGLIDSRQDAELRALRGMSQGELLQRLRARGYLRDHEVVPLVQRYTEHIALEALAEPKSDYRLADDPPPPGVPLAAIPRNPSHLAFEALRRALDGEQVLIASGGLGAIPRLREEDLDLRALTLGDRERRFLGLIDGETSVEELLLASGLRQETALRILAAGAALGWFEIEPAPAQDAPPSAELELDRLEAKFREVQDADYFAILGLARSAGSDEVLRAFQHLSAEFDPLKFAGHPDATVLHRARVVHEALAEAAQVLRDDRLRENYARHLLD
ncbi:MAG: hypothetical protein IRZ16_11515 [Myxococcaceae bacterium]|nr:hypothetical protein [Myxococcaceae bacterium]